MSSCRVRGGRSTTAPSGRAYDKVDSEETPFAVHFFHFKKTPRSGCPPRGRQRPCTWAATSGSAGVRRAISPYSLYCASSPFVEVSVARVTPTGSGLPKRRPHSSSAVAPSSIASPPVWRIARATAPPYSHARPVPTSRQSQGWCDKRCRPGWEQRFCSGRP